VFSPSQVLAERYRLERRIAVGGMGEVWEASDTRLDRKVAVKLLKPELCGNAEFLHRFRTEARMTASLNHPNVASIHDYGETATVPGGSQDTAYLVMELVNGEPLAAILQRQGRISPDRTLNILEQAGHALEAAHERGLVHRDVKPGNVLVTPSGQVKLTDFGIAKAADAAPVTRSGIVMGTAHYIAPEQATGQDAEPASDVYSLAVVGYECLVGHRPFLSENAVTVAMMHIRQQPPPLPPEIPTGIRALIESTLVKDPRKRFRSGGEFAAACAAVRARKPLPQSASGRHTGPNQTQPTARTGLTVEPRTPPMGVPVHSTVVTSATLPTAQTSQPRQTSVGATHPAKGPPTPTGAKQQTSIKSGTPGKAARALPVAQTRVPVKPSRQVRPVLPDAGATRGTIWVVLGALLLLLLLVLVLLGMRSGFTGASVPDSVRPGCATSSASPGLSGIVTGRTPTDATDAASCAFPNQHSFATVPSRSSHAPADSTPGVPTDDQPLTDLPNPYVALGDRNEPRRTQGMMEPSQMRSGTEHQ
jgi:serine/threonine-protein kinase